MTGNFPQLLRAFFYDWLAGQRNNSPHTVRSYRDTWRLFLRFVAARQARLVAALRLADFTGAEVLAFLDHSEKERHVSVGTRNCRLAALRSFFCFVADREPLAAAQCAEILRIPINLKTAVHSSAPPIRPLLSTSCNCLADHLLGDSNFLCNKLQLQPCCSFRSLQLPDLGLNVDHIVPGAIWIRQNWRRFSLHRTVSPWKVNGIMPCWRSFTTLVPAFKRRSIYAPGRFGWNLQAKCGSWEKVGRNVSARSGLRLQTYWPGFCSANHVAQTSRYSSIVTDALWVLLASASNGDAMYG
jgi:hypothetical protein